MVTHFKRAIIVMAAVLMGLIASAQAPDATASWKVSSKETGANEYELIFTASIESGWHIYTTDNKYNPTTLEFDSPAGYSPVGGLTQLTKPSDFQGDEVFFDTAVFSQKVKLEGDEATVKGELTWSGCNDQFCAAPEHWEFSVTLNSGSPMPGSENHATLGTVRGGTVSEANGGAERSEAVWLSEPSSAGGLVLASDAFFPFDDCVTLAAEYGVKAIVQPGGSIRDEDSIKKCDELGIAMLFTGERHFKH